MATNGQRPIGIYLRLSKARGLAEAPPITRQRTDCEAIVERRWPGAPTKEYVDQDRSAYSGRVRPGYRQMCKDLEAGVICGFVAWDQDRLLRLPRELEPLILLCEQLKITRCATASGDLDLTDGDTQLMARVKAAVASKSSADTARRVKRDLADRAANGLWVGGRVPYPYIALDNVLTSRSLLARKLAREGVDHVLSGKSLRSWVRYVTAQDKEAPHTEAGWRRVFASPALCGLNSSGAEGAWSPVCTEIESIELQMMFSAKAKNRRHNGHVRQHFLSGLVICERCRGKMYGGAGKVAKGQPTYDVYRCKGCHRTIKQEWLEAHVTTAIFAVAGGASQRPTVDQTGVDVEAERTTIAARLKLMANQFMRGVLSEEEYAEGKQVAREMMAELGEEQITTVARQEISPSLASDWKGLTLVERHRVTAYMLDSITVGESKSSRPKPERVKLHWSEAARQSRTCPAT